MFNCRHEQLKKSYKGNAIFVITTKYNAHQRQLPAVCKVKIRKEIKPKMDKNITICIIKRGHLPAGELVARWNGDRSH